MSVTAPAQTFSSGQGQRGLALLHNTSEFEKCSYAGMFVPLNIVPVFRIRQGNDEDIIDGFLRAPVCLQTLHYR